MIWTIPELPTPDGSAEAAVYAPNIPIVSEPVVVRLNGEIVGPETAEPPGLDFNNAVGMLSASEAGGRGDHNTGDTAVRAGISNRSPDAEGQTTFTVDAINHRRGFPGLIHLDFNNVQLGVQVRIDLSPGLAFAGTPTPPSGTSFSTTSATAGIWDVGALESGPDETKSLPVVVNLTSDSLADLPLEKRCLTAEVISAVPWFPFDFQRRENDIVTVCLGEAPKALLTSGEISLIDFYPCIGVISSPCTTEDTLELLATAFRRDYYDVWGLSESEKASYLGTILQPESFIVHVPDPEGRATKGGSVIWSTKNLMDFKDSQTRLTSSWSVKESVKVTAPGGGDAPGRWLLTNTDDTPSVNLDLLDARDSSTVSYDFFPLTDYGGTNPERYFLDVKVDFWGLGTYKALFGIAGRLSGATYSDSGTYTFHVGPVAELEVRDAGPDLAVAGDRQAYTVMAVNDGPDVAPAVQVTGLPTAVTEYVASHGQYDPAIGVWTVGELPASDYRSTGYAHEGPTLTLITDDAAGAEFTASIENTQDYCVRIKTGATNPINDEECSGALPTGYTQHSAAYYDHVERNNSATITARAGALPRQGHPDAPTSLTVVETLAGKLIRWQPVERANGHPVAHYQLQRLDLSTLQWEDAAEVTGTMYLDEAASPEFPAYRLRAVNWFGLAGPWSRPAPDTGLDVRGDAPTVTGVSITSTPGAGDTYQLGEAITLDVAFSEAVRVRGTPELALGIGDATRQARMVAHSGATSTFSYTVAAGDRDKDGVSVPEDGLSLPQGSSIASLKGKFAVLGLADAALGNQAGHKVDTPAAPEPAPPYYVDVPGAPGGLTATPGNGQVTLEWDPYCCDQKALHYQFWRGDDPTNWHTIAGSTATTTDHTVTGLTNGNTYHFRVRAVYGESPENPGRPSRMVAARPSAPTTTPNRPPVFPPGIATSSVVERAPWGTEVARVRASDPDGDALVYTLSGENAAKFSIANVGGEGVITVAEMELGFTWEPGGVSFSIGVEVSDARGGRASRRVDVEVTASEERDSPPVAEDPGTVNVACGATANTNVGTIMADDPEGDALWYILVSGGEHFRFDGGGMGPKDSIWSDDHAKLVSDGSGVVLEVGRTLSGEDCGTSIWVVVEIEEDGNPGNNETLSFEVRVGAATN